MDDIAKFQPHQIADGKIVIVLRLFYVVFGSVLLGFFIIL